MPSVEPVAARGYQERTGFGVEDHPNESSTSPYGTVVTCTDFIRHLSNDVLPNDPVPARPSPSGYPVEHYAGAVGDTPRDLGGIPDVRGSISAELDFSVFPLVLGVAMGVYGDTGMGYTIDTITNPNTHGLDFPKAPQPMPHALTMVRYTGRRLLRCGGGYVESLELSGDGGDGPITWNAQMLFQNYNIANAAGSFGSGAKFTDSLTAPGTVSYVQGPIARLHEAKLYINSTLGTATPLGASDLKKRIRSWTLSLGNTYLASTASGVENSSGSCLSGRGIERPVLNAYVPIEFRMNTEWDSDFYQDMLFLADPSQANYGTLELSIIADTDATKTYLFRMPAAKCVSGFPGHGGGEGALPEEIVWRAGVFINASVQPEIFSCVTRNGHAAYFPNSGSF